MGNILAEIITGKENDARNDAAWGARALKTMW
jgi:hypothetical protein